MAFLLDNCVLNEKVPFSAHAVDYSSELNLFAAVDDDLFVWDPETKKTIAQFNTAWDGVGDVLFLPGNYIAVPGGEAHHGSGIEIFSLNEKDAVFEVEGHDGPLALTPDKNLLCGEELSEIFEIRLDLKNMKVLECKEIWSPDYDEERLGTEALCCSSNYTVCHSEFEDSSFSCFDVGFTADGEVSLTNEQIITYCMINGEKRSFGKVLGLAHDGEHVIVGTDQDIVVLESAMEGSPAHVIVSTVKCGHYNETYGIRLNNENQLMVCERDFIKVYDYKRPNSLQGLCRNQVTKSLRQKGKKNTSVEQLPIPQSLKDYLLYKV